MAFPKVLISLFVLGSLSTVFSAIIPRDGSLYVADIKLGKNLECQGVQVSEEKVLTLADCVNTKSLKKYKVVTSDETRSVASAQTSDDGLFILLTTKVKKEKKSEFPGIAANSKGYDILAYIPDKKGFSQVSLETTSSNKCKKLTGFDSKSQLCLSSDAECSYTKGLPVFGSNKGIDVIGFALDGDLCSESNKAATSVFSSQSWIEDNTQEAAKDCGKKLPKIDDGSYKLDNKKDTSEGATASVSCDKGFKASQDKITCQASGDWETATCDSQKADCGKKLPKISDGSVKLDNKKDTSEGSTASVSCDKGFKASQDKIACQASGKWEKATCDSAKIDCGKKLPKIADGSVKLDKKKETSLGATASVSCKKGFEASQDKITCEASGKWETATCDNAKIDCGKKLPKISDGSVKLDDKKDTSAGATATVTCDKGFQPAKNTIECLESGKWEKTDCVAIDCGKSLPKVKDGSIALDDKKKTSFGATATVTCDNGYEAENDKIDCQESGKWSKASCDIVDCGKLPNIKDGSYELDKKKTSTFEATATLTCDEDFIAKDNEVTITCQGSGDWSKIGKCEEVKDCGKVKSLDNGKYKLIGKKTNAGAKASVTCDKGYDPDVKEIECLSSGKWESATCIIKDCGKLDKVSKGSLKLDSKKKESTVGETATLTCDEGYEPKDGKSSITCQTSGDWEEVSCTIKDCGNPTGLANGSYKKKGSTTFGSSATVKCDKGYESTKKEIDCLATGDWDTATCDAKDCGNPTGLANGSYKKKGSTTYGSSATVKCDKGYESTKKEIDCLATGDWETATCTIKDCGNPTGLANGSYKKKGSTTYGSSATVKCDNGYESTKKEIDCLATGDWETATCTIKDCGSVGGIADGNYVLTDGSTVFGSTANVSCNAGFGSTDATITCLSSGSWESATCVADCGNVLPTIDFGTAALISGDTLLGANASVTCNEGYNESVSYISCLDSGDWETANCTIYDCGTPSFDGVNVTVVLDNSNTTTTYGETATVTCPGALVPAMGSTITCLEDGWETPTCVTDTCSAGWTLYDSHCYYYEAFTSADWNAAQSTCESEGGYVAEISSEGELNFLNNLRESSMSAWIGLADISVTNNYVWNSTDQVPTYTNWATGEPVSPGMCVLMNPVGVWQTLSCTKSRNYFCEKE